MTEVFGYLWKDGTWHHDPEGQMVLVEIDNDWKNNNCPELCSVPHPNPPTSQDDEEFPADGVWTCPDTGKHYGARSEGNGVIAWEPIYNWEQPRQIRGDWYPSYAAANDGGFEQCVGCGDWGEDYSWSDYHQEVFCDRCYPDEEAEEDGRRHREADPKQCCKCGSGANLTFQPITEKWACPTHGGS